MKHISKLIYALTTDSGQLNTVVSNPALVLDTPAFSAEDLSALAAILQSNPRQLLQGDLKVNALEEGGIGSWWRFGIEL